MLESLKIVNWKAFPNRSFSFARGLNLFVGPNGSGKTTILDGIALALTGSLAHCDPKKLVRDSRYDSVVELQLDTPNNGLRIIRKFSSERIGGAEAAARGSSLRSESWESLNKRVAQTLGVDPVFFSRIVYMSEGEVFECGLDPPSKALESAIEKAFGLEGLRALLSTVRELLKSYEKLATGYRLRPPTVLQRQMASQEDIASLREAVERGKANAIRGQQDLQSLEARLNSVKASEKLLQQAFRSTLALESESSAIGLKMDRSQGILAQANSFVDGVRAKVEDFQKKIDDASYRVGSDRSRIEYFEGILQLLTSVASDTSIDAAPCPVCRRPIDAELARALVRDTRENLSSARAALGADEKELSDLRADLRRYTGSSDRANRLLQEVASAMRQFPELINLSFVSLQEQIRAAEIAVADCEKDVKELSRAIATAARSAEADSLELARLEGSTDSLELQETARKRLVSAYEGVIVCTALSNAVEETSRQIRDISLKPYYGALAELWRKCRPDHNGDLRFDAEGHLRIVLPSSQLQYSQLSGGEKTVLLILSRVLMCSMFSDIDFLMIDEPLEHLDSRNRRSALNFLAAATRAGLIEQAIVTTFEESLVRKYLGGGLASVTYLSRSHRED